MTVQVKKALKREGRNLNVPFTPDFDKGPENKVTVEFSAGHPTNLQITYQSWIKFIVVKTEIFSFIAHSAILFQKETGK